jgi:hypothetical protein
VTSLQKNILASIRIFSSVDVNTCLFLLQYQFFFIGILEIEAHIDRPFFLHPDVHLVDVLSTDPFQRFVVIGSGVNTHVTIRNFRGDEPEIMEFVEHWRVLIAEYLISKRYRILSHETLPKLYLIAHFY